MFTSNSGVLGSHSDNPRPVELRVLTRIFNKLLQSICKKLFRVVDASVSGLRNSGSCFQEGEHDHVDEIQATEAMHATPKVSHPTCLVT